MNIFLKKTGLHFCQSVNIISTCYVMKIGMCVYKNTHTGLKCLNANFVVPHNCLEGGGGIFKNSEFSFFLF